MWKPGDAVEGEEPDRLVTIERGERIRAGRVGGLEHRRVVALHEPGQTTLRDAGDANERPILEVGFADEAHLLSATAAESKGVRDRKPGEGRTIRSSAGRRVEPVEINVERRLVVKSMDPVVGAAGDQHRFADPPPAVPDADAHRGIRGDRCPHHRIGHHLRAVELVGPFHLEVVAGAAPHQGNGGANDRVGAPDDFLLVARKAIAEEHQDLVRAVGHPGHRRGDLSARQAKPAGGAGRQRRRDREALAA